MSDPCSGSDSSCAEVLAQLETFLDGELTDAQLAGRVAEHLGDCLPCKDRADLEACVRELLRSRCVDRAPASLVARLERLLADQPVARRGS